MSQRELLQRSLEALEVDGNRDFIGLRQQIKYELEKPEPIEVGHSHMLDGYCVHVWRQAVPDGNYKLIAVRIDDDD
jgi:hypothetical protein